MDSIKFAKTFCHIDAALTAESAGESVVDCASEMPSNALVACKQMCSNNQAANLERVASSLAWKMSAEIKSSARGRLDARGTGDRLRGDGGGEFRGELSNNVDKALEEKSSVPGVAHVGFAGKLVDGTAASRWGKLFNALAILTHCAHSEALVGAAGWVELGPSCGEEVERSESDALWVPLEATLLGVAKIESIVELNMAINSCSCDARKRAENMS
jgi:hypothetical protein